MCKETKENSKKVKKKIKKTTN